LTETPVKQAVEAQSASCPTNYAGTLGMAALRRLDLIIDGAHGLAYVRSKNSPPIPYDHNRVATAFIPSDGRKEMIARVVKGGPGFRAGIRNGDSLLKVDGHDAADWKTEPTFYLHDEDPLGTQVAFTLQRGSKTFTAKVGCQQILGPVFDAAFGNLLKNLWVTNDLSKSAITVRLSPLEAEDYFSRGADLYNANFFERAITNFDEAIKLHSTNVLCYFGRGYCENRTGHFSAATFDLSEFLVSETNFLAAYQERGFAYSQLGNLAQAISDFSKCIDLASTNRAALVWALQSRAQAYWLQRDGRHAVEDMRRALEEDPQNTKSHR
jgi:tetratricopeptide (TPR) repeat protein